MTTGYEAGMYRDIGQLVRHLARIADALDKLVAAEVAKGRVEDTTTE